MEELIKVKQLPVIEEHLKQISDEIDKKVELAVSLVCTDETVKEVKKTRTELNNEFKQLEQQRKTVKEVIMKPYNDFDEIYKKYISDKFKDADKNLKEKIDIVETELKLEKENEIRNYFEELLMKEKIDFVKFEQTNINITLSASKKSLKDQAKCFVDKVVDDIKLIGTQQFNDEIMVEYMKTLNVSKAITDVQDRHFVLDSLKEAEEKQKIKQESEEKAVAKVDNVIDGQTSIEEFIEPPVEEKTYCVSFKVYGTKEQLSKLKNFLNQGGYKYE